MQEWDWFHLHYNRLVWLFLIKNPIHSIWDCAEGPYQRAPCWGGVSLKSRTYPRKQKQRYLCIVLLFDCLSALHQRRCCCCIVLYSVHMYSVWYFTFCWSAVTNGERNFLFDDLAKSVLSGWRIKARRRRQSLLWLSLAWLQKSTGERQLLIYCVSVKKPCNEKDSCI